MQNTNCIIESMHVKFDECYDRQQHGYKDTQSHCIDDRDLECIKSDHETSMLDDRVENQELQEKERVEDQEVSQENNFTVIPLLP